MVSRVVTLCRWCQPLLALAVLAVAATCFADTVYLNFPAGMSEETKNEIKDTMQDEFDDAGGGVTVTDDPNAAGTADRTVNFHSGKSPKGDRWGDSGDGKTVNVYVGEFTDDPEVSDNFNTPETLGNGAGETAAHEIGHTYGLEHNEDDPPSKMTRGDLVTPEQRAADGRWFNATDKVKLWYNTYYDVAPIIPGPGGGGAAAVAATVRPELLGNCKHDDGGFVDAGLMPGMPGSQQFDLGELVEGEMPGERDLMFRNCVEAPEDALTLFDGDVVEWAIHGAIGTPLQGRVFTLADYGEYSLHNARYNDDIDRWVYGTLEMHWHSDDPLAPFDYLAVLNADAKLPGTENGFYNLLPGDLNCDNFVGADDLDIIRAFWGQHVVLGELRMGDVSCDGFVGADDLDIIRAFWGESIIVPPGTVPEPATIIYLMMGAMSLAVVARGRRRQA